MIELECLLIQIFPEGGTRGEPFTLKEISDALSEVYGRIPYSRVYHAFAELSKNPHTAAVVRPLEGDGRYHLFTAVAARRIARRVVKGHLPAKLQHFEKAARLAAKSPKTPKSQKSEAKRNSNVTRMQSALAERPARLHAV